VGAAEGIAQRRTWKARCTRSVISGCTRRIAEAVRSGHQGIARGEPDSTVYPFALSQGQVGKSPAVPRVCPMQSSRPFALVVSGPTTPGSRDQSTTVNQARPSIASSTRSICPPAMEPSYRWYVSLGCPHKLAQRCRPSLVRHRTRVRRDLLRQ
jgi:hypothetical protein